MAGWVPLYLCLSWPTTCKLQVESVWNYVCSLVLVHVSFHMGYLPDLEIHGHVFSKERLAYVIFFFTCSSWTLFNVIGRRLFEGYFFLRDWPEAD